MKARLVRVGNSRGVRIPKPLIEEARLEDEVVISVRDRSLIITSVESPRFGWAEAARLLRSRGEDRPSEPDTPTRFDQEEWQWR